MDRWCNLCKNIGRKEQRKEKSRDRRRGGGCEKLKKRQLIKCRVWHKQPSEMAETGMEKGHKW